MMAQKHLHELLKEDQEPFHLKNYIEDRRCVLKRPSSKTTLQPWKRKPIIETSIKSHVLCKQVCFLPFLDSPDVTKSPFPDFLSQGKSPCKSPNRVFLHIPARTAALLLEAAMRIQKQSSASNPKTQIKNVGFGLFGSILNRLKDRKRTKNREICVNGASVLAKDSSFGRGKFARNCEKLLENEVAVDVKSVYEMGLSFSCNNSRLSSAGWSESNEEKSFDLETSSSSSRSEDSEEIEFVAKHRENATFSPCESRFCSSPFRFSLQTSPSPVRRTSRISSPVASPIHYRKKDREHCEADILQKNQEEEEEKEQCSPVSVLDTSFDDSDDVEQEEDEQEEDYDLECSYAVVQRTKQQLLQKLRRFERLAELDPIELEKRMLEEQDDDEDQEEDGEEEEEECEDDESPSSCGENDVERIIREILNKSKHHHVGKIPADLRKLLLDIIAEEKREQNGFDDSEMVRERVWKRLNSWKQVESNTIDMMVELDFRRELQGWKRNQEQVGETAIEIELSIFGLLVEELSEELVCLD